MLFCFYLFCFCFCFGVFVLFCFVLMLWCDSEITNLKKVSMATKKKSISTKTGKSFVTELRRDWHLISAVKHWISNGRVTIHPLSFFTSFPWIFEQISTITCSLFWDSSVRIFFFVKNVFHQFYTFLKYCPMLFPSDHLPVMVFWIHWIEYYLEIVACTAQA